MSGRVPACFGNNIIDKAQVSKHKSLSCINGRVSLTGQSPKIVPISVPYPGQHCTPYVAGGCNTGCGYKK